MKNIRDLIITTPGIEKICMVAQSNVMEGADLASMSGSPILLPLGMSELEFVDEPTLTIKTSVDTNAPVTELTLAVKMMKDLPYFGYCYAVKTVSGEGYLLGSYEMAPTIDLTESSGTASGDARIKSYSIGFKLAGNPIMCVI